MSVVESLLHNTFAQLKSQAASDNFVLQRTVINILFSLLPCSRLELLECVTRLLAGNAEELDFKAFLFHTWTLLVNEKPSQSSQDIQNVINQVIKEVLTEPSKEGGKRAAKVPHQRKSQAENQSQRRDKFSPLQSEVITLLSSFLISPSNMGTELVLDDIASSVSAAGGSIPPLIACNITVSILQASPSESNEKVNAFREKIAPYLCGYLHSTRSGLKTFVIDNVLPSFYSGSTNSASLQVLWSSIVLLPDEMETLRYFFKFGSLFISTARREGADFKIFEDKRLWDAIKKGLTAADSMPRKQALYLLKNIVHLPQPFWNKVIPWNSTQWDTFFSLYEAMDESKSHLLKPIWGQIETLVDSPNPGVVAPFELEPTASSYWLAVLFTRGITHGNPNVRDLVLPSLFVITPQVLQLESSFLLDTLLMTFNDVSLETLDATIEKYSELLGKFWFNYLLTFVDYDVTAQGFTASLIEYLRDSATITTPAIIFFLESLIQLRSLHESTGKETLLLSHKSLEYLRSILECRPIAESTIQNSKLYDEVLITAIKLTDVGSNAHPPSAFDFASLARFLSSFPLSFLRSGKRLLRVVAWLARFEHLDAQHLQTVLHELWENSGDHFDSKTFKQNLSLFSRVFAVNPILGLFAELVGEVRTQLESKGPRLDLTIEIVRSILQELYALGLDAKTTVSFGVVFEPVVSSLVVHFKAQATKYLSQILSQNAGDIDIDEEANRLNNYATFINVCWKAFPILVSQQSSNLVDMFTGFSTFFVSSTGSSYPITIINAVLNYWYASGQNLPAQAWQTWNDKDKLPELIFKLLKVAGRGSGSSTSKTNELVSTFISTKWNMLTLLVEKSQDLNLPLNNKLANELFECGLEVLDQADYESLPCVYSFLHTLLYRNSKERVPEAFSKSADSSVDQLLESAWKSFSECKRKTVPLIATFIGLIFHPIIFRVASEKVRPYLRKAIVEFAESPRIASSVAAHVCGVCATDLSLAFTFLPELVDMCLVTEPAHLFGFPALPEYNAWSEGHGLVITALVAGLPKDATTNNFLGQLMLALLEQNFTNSEFATREHSQHSQTNKRKVRMWFTLSALVEYLEADSAHLEKIAEKAWLSLQIKNHKNIRRLIQSFMLKFLHKHDRFLALGLFPLLEDTNLQYQVGASVVIISARILLETQSSSPLPPFWMPLFRKLVPWSFHFHHAVRTCAQVALYTLMENGTDMSAFEDPSLTSMFDFLRTNKDCVRLRVRQRWFATKKQSISAQKGAANSKRERETAELGAGEGVDEEGLEDEEEDGDVSIPMDLLEHVKKAVKEFQASMSVTDPSIQKPETEKEEASDFQKRILPWQMLDSLPQLETRELKKNRQSIIVVASLIDNTPNIAGLVRTSEIFNVEAVVIGNKKIENEAQFQRVSVSAEKWVPILEVAPSNLPLFIKEKSAQGYTILGVEQTAHSESLTSYEFPDKCVLVLGQEQLGIPADIIQLLDKCVEIPQLGMIRSLNVHVSASIVIWTYTQQHLRGKINLLE